MDDDNDNASAREMRRQERTRARRLRACLTPPFARLLSSPNPQVRGATNFASP